MVSVHRLNDMGIHDIWYGELPKGCIYCISGAKAIIFISGLCGVDCYYCPISFERRKSTAFYIDEERFRNISDIVDEISMIRAKGASISGGEPFQIYHMAVNIIKMLKDVFGSDFHIHLYTSGYGATKEAIKNLSRIGLDEIRFHIVNHSILKLVEFSVRETYIDVGIEIPAIPDVEWLWRIVIEANNANAKFVNINELEVSETNIDNILIRGYKINKDGRSIEGSLETAIKVVEKAYSEQLRISVHVCSARFKDLVQHRNRLKRKSIICAMPNDTVNDDGTIKRKGEDIIPMLNMCSDYIKI